MIIVLLLLHLLYLLKYDDSIFEQCYIQIMHVLKPVTIIFLKSKLIAMENSISLD